MSDEPGQEPLRRLEQRLSQASDAAERLIAEAARTGTTGRPPPAGWQLPDESRPEPRPGGELEVLVQAIQALRDLLPEEVMERITAALRELLVAVRALIDFYLERLEHRRSEPAEVQEIPID
jgi:hypothetical protein